MTEETKAEAFKRLGNARLDKALDAIELLEALANVNSYEYDDDQVEAVIDALNEAVKSVSVSFANGGPKRKTRGII